MIHEALAAGRWQKMTLAEQLGNVGSEFERVLAAQKSGNKSREDMALSRFLELLDLTLMDGRWAGPRRRELARLREQSLEEFGKDHIATSESLSRYYMNFATLARSK